MKQGIDYIGVSVTGLLLKDKKVLLLYRNKSPEKDKFGLIGGRIELNETAEDAIIRETKEEIGVDIEIVKMLGVTNQIIKKEGTHWVCINYLIKLCNENDEPKNMEPNTHKEMKWFDFKYLPENLSLTAQQALNDYMLTIPIIQEFFNLK